MDDYKLSGVSDSEVLCKNIVSDDNCASSIKEKKRECRLTFIIDNLTRTKCQEGVSRIMESSLKPLGKK